MTDERRTPPSSEEDAVPAEAAAGLDAGSEGDVSADEPQALAEELERVRAAHARALADYQNLQRRSREERGELMRLTMKSLVLNYLPVLDDLNRALDSVSEHDELTDHPWVDGVRIVQRKFLGVLDAAGVRPIEAAVGVPFNPELHEAVANQPGPLNEVIGVVQGGYQLDGAVIRPAMVIVGAGAPEDPSPQ